MLGGLTLVEGSLAGLLDNTVGRLVVLLVLSAAGLAIYLLVAAALRARARSAAWHPASPGRRVLMRFRVATDADAEAWQALLEATASGDFLHDWAWAEVAAFDGQPQRRYLLEDDGRIVAIAAPQERRLVMGRTFWYVPHGPVLDWSAPEAGTRLDALLDGLRTAAREHRAVAVKLEPRLTRGTPELGRLHGRGLRRTDEALQVGHTRLVSLTDDSALIAGFDKDTRYAVRRAAREGVDVTAVEDATDLSAVDALHRLVGETQRRAGFPMPRLERHRTARGALAGAGRAVILEARRGDELLASGMLVLEGDRSFYLFSGSLARARRAEATPAMRFNGR